MLRSGHQATNHVENKIKRYFHGHLTLSSLRHSQKGRQEVGLRQARPGCWAGGWLCPPQTQSVSITPRRAVSSRKSLSAASRPSPLCTQGLTPNQNNLLFFTSYFYPVFEQLRESEVLRTVYRLHVTEGSCHCERPDACPASEGGRLFCEQGENAKSVSLSSPLSGSPLGSKVGELCK